MRKALLIIAVLLATVFAAEGRRPRISRMERAPLGIISDTIVYKVDSTGAQIIGLDSLPMMDDEEVVDTVIEGLYGDRVDKRQLYLYDSMSDSDLDNDALIDAIESSPSFSRNSVGLSEIRSLRA